MYMPLMIEIRQVLLLIADEDFLPGEAGSKGKASPLVREKLRGFRPFLPKKAGHDLPEGLRLVRQSEVSLTEVGSPDWQALLPGAVDGERSQLAVSCLPSPQFDAWNRSLLAFCRKHGILCNVADQKEFCNTWFMSVAQTDHLLLGVSSKGRCPYYAALLRRELQGLLEQREPEAALLTECRMQLRADGLSGRRLVEALRELHQSEAFVEAWTKPDGRDLSQLAKQLISAFLPNKGEQTHGN